MKSFTKSLMNRFYEEKGILAINTYGEYSNIYVDWLENRIIDLENPDNVKAKCCDFEAMCKFRSATDPTICFDPTDLCDSKRVIK